MEQSEKIQLKLTYNRDKNMPRTFFVHLYHVPLDAVVNITQAERELPVTRGGDSGGEPDAGARFVGQRQRGAVRPA